jgi:hypothetical protein
MKYATVLTIRLPISVLCRAAGARGLWPSMVHVREEAAGAASTCSTRRSRDDGQSSSTYRIVDLVPATCPRHIVYSRPCLD